MKKIIVIGGAGYVGTKLVTELLKKSFDVTVYDLFIYGNHLPKNKKNLKIEIGDVRNLEKLKKVIKNQDVVIHLACLSNDPSYELNPKLSLDVNYLCFEPLVRICKELKISHFIYTSSSSVYGVKNEKKVTEHCSLDPLTDYSRFKAECENVLLKYSNNDFVGTIIRPATVCGYSPRQRLDLVVNILTNYAYHNKEIKVFGGQQLRPNIHIDDIVRAYICILEADKKKISNEIFNVGFENYTIEELALMVKNNMNHTVKITYEKSDDNRSYHISSEKISNLLKFYPEKSINTAIKDLVTAFEKKILINTFSDPIFYNLKKMQLINLQ